GLLDRCLGSPLDRASSAGEKAALLLRAHEPEQVPGLLEVVVVVLTEVEPVRVVADCDPRLPVGGVSLEAAVVVGRVAGRGALVAVHPARTITVVGVDQDR